MKKLYTFFALIIAGLMFSQQYKDKLSREMCQCIEGIDAMGKTQKQLEFALGICMLKVATPYHKEIKKDYGFDLKGDLSDSNALEKLGETMGMLMVTDCPDAFGKLYMSSAMGQQEGFSSDTKVLNGTISKIDKQDFIVFHISGDNRVLTKLHWVFRVDSDVDLPAEYNTVLNRRVTVSYYPAELFDVKSGQYKTVNMITSMKTD